jgi:glycine/D-amino acid oxidase-like deaminating enzyme
MTTRADVLIVGGAVIGTALAVELAGRGVSVTVVESGKTASKSSVSPRLDRHDVPPPACDSPAKSEQDLLVILIC